MNHKASRTLKIVSNFNFESLECGQMYSFMNFASLRSYFDTPNFDQINYYCDGFLMAAIVKIMTGSRVERISFDYTSIAARVFDYAVDNNKRIYVLGAEQLQLENFLEKISVRHSGLNISGARNGYFSDEDDVVSDILKSNSDIVIVGLGAQKQEEFLLRLQAADFGGISFTCGGFIRQESESEGDYYPQWLDKLNLRAFYRMYKEPHTIKRYLIDYPVNGCYILNAHYKKMIKIKIIGELE